MDGWKEVLATVAPAVAAALGGPLMGVATTALSQKLLGKKDGSMADIANAVLSASPGQLLELKQLDLEFEKLQVQREGQILEDKANARARQIALKDKTPANITYILLTSFVGLMAALVFVEVPEPNKALVYSMIGILGAITSAAVYYHVGSSIGSKAKTMISELKRS